MRFGVVGVGWAARNLHVPAINRVPGTEVIGGVDSSPEQRASWVRETSADAYATVDELLDRGRPDVVVVATPPSSHVELCLELLSKGVHVFCEKPFVETVADADRVLAAADDVNRHVAVNQQYRYMPIFSALRAQIDSAEAGRLVFSQIWQLMNVPPWEEPVPWRAAMPDRTLFEAGVHLVDLLLHLYDAKPTAVYARRTSGLDRTKEADAIHLVILEFPDGRLAQITIDRLCPAGTRYLEIRADCERASLRASMGGRALLRIGKKRAQRAGVRLDFAQGGLAWMERGEKYDRLARNGRGSAAQATTDLLRHLVDALREGREPPSSGHQARNVLAVIEAAYESAATGQRIEISYDPRRSERV